MEKEGIIMSGSAPTIVKIRQLFPSLKGNNRRIAEQLLTSPELLMSKKLNDIANACSCDPAQVIRFCQTLGFKGFSELKNRVARELIPLPVEKEEKRNKADAFEQFRTDYCRSVAGAINDTLMNLDKTAVLKAVKNIHDAERIVICGAGASNLTAQDLHIKLLRMGFNSSCFADQEMQKINCALLGKSDLLIVFSFSGNTASVIQCMKTAKANGGTVLLITNCPASKAAGLADLMLNTAAEEEKLRLGAMISRMTQLAVIDLLVSNLALKYPDDINPNIFKTFHAIS